MRIGQKLSYSIALLVISNIITGVTGNEDLSYYSLKVIGISLLIMPMTIIKKEFSRKVISWIILILSIPTLLDNDPSNMTGFILFLFSLSLSERSRNLYVVYAIIFITILLVKFNTNNMKPSQIIGYTAGLSFVAIFYLHYIYPKEPKKTAEKETETNYLVLPVKKTVIDILELRILGLDWWEINDKLELTCTPKWTNEQVNKEMKLHGFKNREGFILWLAENGAIKTKKSGFNTN